MIKNFKFNLSIALLVLHIIYTSGYSLTAKDTSLVSYSGKYSLVLVGGGLNDNNTQIWDKIIELGGGKSKAKFCVIASAGENPCCDIQSSYYAYNKLLLHYGAAEVYYIPITVDSKENNSNPEVIDTIKSCTGFFFSGVTYSFYNQDGKVPSPALIAIKETLMATGGVAAGTSAGTDCQTSSIMITCGRSYEGLKYGSYIFWRTFEMPDVDKLTAYGTGGIGLFNYGLLDTHFANRGRQGRMIKLMADSLSLPSGHTRAFAIDENTALVVLPKETGGGGGHYGTLIGERGALVLDFQKVKISEKTDNTSIYSIYGVKASRMSSGDSWDFNLGTLTPAAYKMPIKQTNNDVYASKDIFNGDTFEFDSITSSLFQSVETTTKGYSKESDPRFVMEIGKEWSDVDASYSGITATSYGGVDPDTGIYQTCFDNLWIHMYPDTAS